MRAEVAWSMRILRGLSCEANILTAICNRWNVPIGSVATLLSDG